MSGCGCDSGELMPLSQALERLLADVRPLVETESVGVEQARCRVLAQDLLSSIAVPPADNSAMDGYAVNTAGLPEDLRLPVSQRIPAGAQGQPLQPGTAARIFTGSEIPPGADAVIMQEQCEQQGEYVQLNRRPQTGDHIRPAGQDIRPGQCAVPAGTRLDARHLGVIASVGIDRVPVYRRLRVAVLNTGDELLMPGQPNQPGKIYNSNYFTLKGLLEPLGVDVIFSGVVEDSLATTRDALALAAQQSDLILSSGGVSVGEEDHVKAAVQSLGELGLWRMAIKPGKPLAYGRVGTTPFIGLPGNPAAVLVTFLMLARPYLLKMQGCTALQPSCFQLPAGFGRERAIPRDEFIRARLVQGEAGLQAAPLDNQSSGVLSSAIRAGGLLLIPAGERVAPGQLLNFYPFHGVLD
ncbi:molybdopterin molybdenumtransferase MoeA [Marinobacterium zhoushanense]|uniref:Molybdopterin molybdenumtransferase n=1 Tax=Marinobacterium zhoushanense TaxID=1679163 RepID=A0ABQ1KKW3_9GAMM|nr:gephyrin-like molybdotransferase Glp [Marinobacterium zhoushanense]GGB99318.1 molybdopterin molybdenumtransferase MoeA [Marinobacterium zhoushanense]